MWERFKRSFDFTCFMQKLLREIKILQRSEIDRVIQNRLKEFKSLQNKPSKEWFSELCFCLLTANSKAKTGIAIQKELGYTGFCNLSQKNISLCIRKNKHRFHNNKSKYIVGARKYIDIKRSLSGIIRQKGQVEARNWLAENVKGMGYKEASHFLRNVGFFDVAILDRHILKLMAEHGLINMPKSLSKKKYGEIEEEFRKISKKASMEMGELDMYMWYLRTGEVLK